MAEPEKTEVIMAHPNLAAALAAFQNMRPDLAPTAEARIPPKDGKSGYSYRYATLADVERAVLPPLGAVGLSWHCKTTMGDRGMLLVCALMHESGEALESVFPLPNPGNPQAFGSLLTYFKRYALMMATGVSAAEDDDDGAAAQQASQRRQEPQERPAQQRPDPGLGTRQGSANEAAKAILAARVDKLPSIWEQIQANGLGDWKVSNDTAQAMADFLAGLKLAPETIPGQMEPHLPGASLRGVAAFSLARAAQEAPSYAVAADADKAYTTLVRMDEKFAALRVPGGDKLGDYIALNAAARREPWDGQDRERNSDPEQNDSPPWKVDADPPYGKQEQAPDISGYDDEGDEGDRPAVLEGT